MGAGIHGVLKIILQPFLVISLASRQLKRNCIAAYHLIRSRLLAAELSYFFSLEFGNSQAYIPPLPTHYFLSRGGLQ